MTALIECVPNFSEGRSPEVIRQITDRIAAVPGVTLLHVDPGHDYQPDRRDLRRCAGGCGGGRVSGYSGRRSTLSTCATTTALTHAWGPPMSAPWYPYPAFHWRRPPSGPGGWASGSGGSLAIPVYLYEAAQPDPARRNLAAIRAGEYEGLAEKLSRPEWRPDCGPAEFECPERGHRDRSPRLSGRLQREPQHHLHSPSQRGRV